MKDTVLRQNVKETPFIKFVSPRNRDMSKARFRTRFCPHLFFTLKFIWLLARRSTTQQSKNPSSKRPA